MCTCMHFINNTMISNTSFLLNEATMCCLMIYTLKFLLKKIIIITMANKLKTNKHYKGCNSYDESVIILDHDLHIN